MKYKHALVRPPGKSFLKAISSIDQSKNIDLDKALDQHVLYCQALEKTGIKVVKLPAEEAYPDSCFVEDACVVFGKKAFMTILGAVSRRGEGETISQVIGGYKQVVEMAYPATMDGGDVLVTQQKIFIGKSARTNDKGIWQFKQLLAEEGLPEVVGIPVEKYLHLKTAVTYIGKNTVLLSLPDYLPYFTDFNIINVEKDEAYGADSLAIGDYVLVPTGCPALAKEIKKLGFTVFEIEMSEFKKADGSITCLSILF